MADRDHDVLQAVPIALVIVNIARADDADADSFGKADERAVTWSVAVDEVVLQFDKDAGGAEPAHKVVERGLGTSGLMLPNQPWHEALAAAGEQDQARTVLAQRLDRETGVEPSCFAGHCCVFGEPEGDAGEAAEVAITLA